MKKPPFTSRPETWLLLLAFLGIAVGTLATFGQRVLPALPSLAYGTSQKPTPDDEQVWRIQDEDNTVRVFEAVKRGVVMVSTEQASSSVAALAMRGNGSGFFIDSHGHIVTNQHVVEGATKITVHTYSGKAYPASVVGADRLTDLAVLHVHAPKEDIVPLALADYDGVQVGQKAIAVGMPLATGSNMGLDRSPTVTTGIISAKDRSLPIESRTKPGVNDFTVENLLQTDAAVNPGNSGGPLLNSSGEVVGVVTAILDDASGIGFAIPSNVVAEVVPQILMGGEVRRAYIGISYLRLDELVRVYGEDVIASLGLPTLSGALVTEADPGGPADKAGIVGSTKKVTVAGLDFPVGGDLIVAMDGTPVSGSDLSGLILKHKPGDKVTLEVFRGDRRISVSVTLGSR